MYNKLLAGAALTTPALVLALFMDFPVLIVLILIAITTVLMGILLFQNIVGFLNGPPS